MLRCFLGYKGQTQSIQFLLLGGFVQTLNTLLPLGSTKYAFFSINQHVEIPHLKDFEYYDMPLMFMCAVLQNTYAAFPTRYHEILDLYRGMALSRNQYTWEDPGSVATTWQGLATPTPDPHLEYALCQGVAV